MSWRELETYAAAAQSLQKGWGRGRLAHAYLIAGESLESLEMFARTIAKCLNCQNPPRVGQSGLPLDCCDQCLSCRKVDHYNHPDIQWIRAESKSRQIRGDQIGDLLQTVYLRPNEARYKVNMIVAADRLNATAANRFLKTLEEPPADSVLVLLSTAPEQVLETLRSRCQRLTLFDLSDPAASEPESEWLQAFGAAAASDSGGLLERYRLLSVLLKRLSDLKSQVEERLTADSPLEKEKDLEPEFRERLEDELAASVEAEYRRLRGGILGALQWWLRDVWLQTLEVDESLCRYPRLREATSLIAGRLTAEDAMSNLEEMEKTQRLLNTNVQEALALEVGLLSLKL
jgi:DNA polymerase-3 subunit delta'